MTKHLTLEELNEGLSGARESPMDDGELKAIVIRPETNLRESLAECEVSPEGGVHGDNWGKRHSISLPEDESQLEDQITIMNSRAISLIAQSEDRWQLAGDNLYIDLDLTEENLPIGQRLAVGSAVLETTAESHNGCGKFAQRYGADATKFVNSKVGKELNLRGIYAKVVTAGTIRVGDVVRKI